MRSLHALIWPAAVGITLSACAGSSAPDEANRLEPPPEPAVVAVSERMEAVDGAVAAWRDSTTVEAAHAAAEAAANLVVGPNGPGYGDRDGDGVITGETTVGVLPGLEGTPSGLATSLALNECIASDVLGGPWTNPGAEWAAMLAAIEDWRIDNNTMPTLPSHPMRVVGWATFTLESDSLDEAHEYARHAKLHVDISHRAIDC